MSDSPYQIRLARPDEVALLPAIEFAAARLFANTGLDLGTLEDTAPLESLAAAQRAGMLWVAIAPGGEPVGFAYGRMLGGEPHLEELDVHPDHGRRGLGARLVRALIEWARAHGTAGVTLSTFRDVAWNAPFYARLGFRALDPEELGDAHRELIAIEVKKGLPVERRVVMRLGLRSSDPFYLRSQYGDAANLEARIALHRRFGTNPVGWPRWLAEQLPDLAGKRVLDVGCGSAALWRSELARLLRSARLVLCDLSPGMVRAARAALGDDARLRFAAADAQRIPFRGGAFDCVLANHMLYHVADRARAIAEIARVLAPGGTLVAATNGERHLAEIDALLRRHGAQATALATSMLEAFTLENGGAQLAAAFGDVALRRYDDGLAVTEAPPLLAYIRSMGPLDAALRGAIERDVAHEIERAGAFRVTKDAGVFVARR